MAQVVIENPITNSPFAEPTRHFRFGDEGITNEVVDGRRSSSYFIPIAKPKKKGKQLVLDTEWVQDRSRTQIDRMSPDICSWYI
jgi:type III restriction enzyme